MTPGGGALRDSPARKRAATDFETNLVVVAGAGTGKTSLLVERLLNTIGGGRATIDDVAAITFTDKAAGEMRVRLAQGLDRLRALARGQIEPTGADEAVRSFVELTSGEDATPAEQIASRALRAMEELDRAKITTIHGFCSEILRAHPVEAGVDPDFVVDSGEQTAALREELWEEFLIAELGPDARRPDEWLALLERISLATVGEIAKGLASFAVPRSLLRSEQVSTDAREVLGPAATSAAGEIRELLARQSGMTALALRCFEGLAGALETFVADGLDAFHAYLEGAGDLSDRIVKSSGFPSRSKKVDGVSDEEWKSATRAGRLLSRGLMRIDDRLFEAVLAVVAPYAVQYRERVLRRGIVGFDGMLSLARDLLADAPEVRRALKKRYRMLLVDEFQDTDPLQHEIVLFLGETVDGEASGAYDARLGPGRLFVVGDPKQSIYRFRGADYSAYRRAKRRILDEGGAELELVTNFRSVEGVIEPVNRLFADPSGCWSASDADGQEYQPAYERIEPFRARADGAPAVEVLEVSPTAEPTTAPPLARERRDAEARVLADEIARLVETGETEYRKISILFRAFTHIGRYLRPLRERGIPFVVDGGREFLERPEVEQLLATLRTLAQPSNQPALLAFLRSPAGAVSDRELVEFAEDAGSWDWQVRHTTERDHPRITTCFETLRELREETRHLPADAVVRRVLDRSLLLPLGGTAFEGAQRVANLEKLAASASTLARDGRLSLEEVIAALEEGRFADIDTDRPLSDDAAEAVRLTTIHKMKGLENDWIFIPDLARSGSRGSRNPPAASVARFGETHSALALRADPFTNAAAVWLDAENERHELAEEARVLYVATTRARERLVLLTPTAARAAPWIDALAPLLAPGATPRDGESPYVDSIAFRRVSSPDARSTATASALPDLHEAIAGYDETRRRMIGTARPPLAAPSRHDEGPGQPATPPARAGDRGLGRAVGSAVHRLLETADTEDAAQLESRLEALCRVAAISEGVDADALFEEGRSILRRFLDSELWTLYRTVDQAGREFPVLMRGDDGRTWRGSVDLLYREPTGGWVVADYKTDHDTDEARLLERHAAQLGTYAEAVRRALGLADRPRAEMWVLRSGRRLTVGGGE